MKMVCMWYVNKVVFVNLFFYLNVCSVKYLLEVVLPIIWHFSFFRWCSDNNFHTPYDIVDTKQQILGYCNLKCTIKV